MRGHLFLEKIADAFERSVSPKPLESAVMIREIPEQKPVKKQKVQHNGNSICGGTKRKVLRESSIGEGSKRKALRDIQNH